MSRSVDDRRPRATVVVFALRARERCLQRLRLRLRLREYRSRRLDFSFGSSSRCRFFLSFPRSWAV